MFYKIYAVNKLSQALKIFTIKESFFSWVWGMNLEEYIIIISTPNGDTILPWEKMHLSTENIERFIEALIN